MWRRSRSVYLGWCLLVGMGCYRYARTQQVLVSSREVNMTVVVSQRGDRGGKPRRSAAIALRSGPSAWRRGPRPPALVGAAAALSALLVGGGQAHLAAPGAGAFEIIMVSTAPGIAAVFVMTLAFRAGYDDHPVLRWTGFGFLAVLVPVMLGLLTSGAWNAILAQYHLAHANVVAFTVGFVIAIAPMMSFFVGAVVRQDEELAATFEVGVVDAVPTSTGELRDKS